MISIKNILILSYNIKLEEIEEEECNNKVKQIYHRNLNKKLDKFYFILGAISNGRIDTNDILNKM